MCDPAAVYEIVLHDALPAAVTSKFPAITVQPTPATTVLSRSTADLADMDRLIERLCSLGITPLEVHASTRSYEFRIAGRLSESTVRQMDCTARLDQERTILRVTANPVELQMILKELFNRGVGIDHIVCHPGT